MDNLTLLSYISAPDKDPRISVSTTRTFESISDLAYKLDVEGVRILPPAMVFKDAYDGKYFQQSLVIINCGKKQVTVRVGRPSSMKFKMKPVMRILPTGLSITRKISFTYSSATSVPQACVSIYVNDTFINYPLLVMLCYSHITVNPSIIDFGNIDIGISSGIRRIKIQNQGTKNAQFSIDLGRNELELVVEPMKGNIKPSGSLKVRLELFAMRPGAFSSEFWIKSDPPRRVKLIGKFIRPQLMFEYPTLDNFTTLLFPKMYFGTSYSKILIIKNFSSASCMFCVLAELNEKLMVIKEAKSKYMNFRQFNITPVEGRLLAESEVAIRVTFCPLKKSDRPYYISMYRIMKVAFRDFPKNLCAENFSKKCSHINADMEPAEVNDKEEMTTADEVELSSLSHLELYLYGEVESPRIKLRPDSFFLKNLRINEIHGSEIYIENMSQCLPIAVKANKAVCIEFEPQMVILRPNASVEIFMKIKPSKLSEVVNKIKFDLFDPRGKFVQVGVEVLEVTYSGKQEARHREPVFSIGLTPLHTNEVGVLTGDVRFNTKIKMPRQAIVDKKWPKFNKTNDALIAFPNDRPKCLRPWRETVPCNTIFAGIPRTIATCPSLYDLSASQQMKKEEMLKYYLDYIRKMNKKSFILQKISYKSADYDLTDKALLLMENESLLLDCVEKQPRQLIKHYFIPMTPEELFNISIRPKFIYLGRLALHTFSKGYFCVENKNNFSILVMMQPLGCSVQPSTNHTIIAADTCKNIYFTYHSEAGGKQHVPVLILINFTHVFDVTVLARIVPKTTHCLNNELVIDPKDNFAIIEMANPMQSPINFMIDPCFYELKPKPGYGSIPPKRKICNSISYMPKVENEEGTKEIYVSSESGAKHLIKVTYDSRKPQVVLSADSLNFGEVSLNVPTTKQLTVRNMSNEHVKLKIDDSNLIEEIQFSVLNDIIPPKSDLCITVTVHLKEMFQFQCVTKVILQDVPKLLEIVGNASFPTVSFIPDAIKLHKVVAGSLTTTTFKIKNNSTSTVYVTFPLEDYPEFNVTSDGVKISTLELQTKEVKELSWDFFPTEAMAYCIFLPYVLNNILGPPELNNPMSLKPATYINISDSPRKAKVDIPNKINTLKIMCSASSAWLKFNTLNIRFLYYNGQGKSFEITNISDKLQTVYLDVISVKHFTITPEEELEYHLGYYRADLEPQTCKKFNVMFVPQTHGIFSYKIPIMVENFYEGSTIFNNLLLDGVYPIPYIIASPRVLHFPTVPLGFKYSLKVEIHLLTHEKLQCNERVNVDVLDKTVAVSSREKDKVSDYDREVELVVEFMPNEEMILDSKIVISCSCYTAAEVYLKGAASFSILKCLNLTKTPKVKCEDYSPTSTYPYFPNESDNSLYAKQMRGILRTLEKWIYEQGFFYKNYYRIPDTICCLPIDIVDPKKKERNTTKKKAAQQLPLIQLLINLVNRSILAHVDCGLTPSPDDFNQTLYLYASYKNVLAFLKSQRAYDPRIRPEHLLPYKDYVNYNNKIEKEEDSRQTLVFDESQFYSFSKRCWVDLLLNIYKVFVLDRTVSRYIKPKTKETLSQETDDVFQAEFQQYLNKHLKTFTRRNVNEMKLLLWLEYHYNKNRLEIWSEESVEKSIQHFEDTADSLALAAVTAAYCPYIKDQIQDMYPIPVNKEQLVHNTCRLIQTWQNLGISFSIHPTSVRKLNRILKLMIISYLFAVLPTFYPQTLIQITCPLAETGTHTISIRNNEDCAIGYTTKLYGETELFQVESSFTIAPKKQTELVVSYLSKTIQKSEAVLLINGEACGQKYGRSMAVTLQGSCDISSCEEFTVVGTVFKTTTKKINVTSPYATAYTSKLSVSIAESPQKKDLFLPMSVVREKNLPRQITTTEQIDFDENGNGVVVVQMCYLCIGEFSYLVCFSDENIGDFCIKVVVKIRTNKNNMEDIKVKLSDNFQAKKCTCKKEVKFSCSRTFGVAIPSMNNTLLQNLNSMIDIWVKEDNAKYWNEVIREPLLAFRFLKQYIGKFPKQYMQFLDIFADSATYKSQTNKKKKFSIPEMFRIRDTSSQGTTMLTVHWDSPDYPSDEVLVLENENGKEIRYYKLTFDPPPRPESSGLEIGGEGEE